MVDPDGVEVAACNPQSSEDGQLDGLIFDIERFAVHDGPGIRTAVFVKGCPLRCLWCHNPESQRKTPELAFFSRNCIEGCYECMSVCANGALKLQADRSPRTISILREKCNNCFDCVRVCPSGSMAVLGERMTVNEVVAKVQRNQLFYRRSGGGVTVTGGEPLAQWAFVRALLQQCRSRGIHTALDTCGYGRWGHLRELLEFTDLLLFDLKEMDREKHERFTGVSNDVILENLLRVSDLRVPIAIRIPLIPGYTSTEENVRAVGLFARELSTLRQIELLPYHRLGETKYKMLDRSYELGELRAPSDGEVEHYRNILEEMGYRVQVGG